MIEVAADGLTGLTRTALNPESAIPIDRYPQTISNITNINYQRTVDDANLDVTFQWIPEATGRIDKFFINIATIMAITARTADGVTFNDVTITITKTGGDDVLYEEAFATGLGERTANADDDLFIVAHPVLNQSFNIRAGNAMNIRVRATMTVGTGATAHMGICPFFPQQVPATAADVLFWAHSGIMFYISRNRRT